MGIKSLPNSFYLILPIVLLALPSCFSEVKKKTTPENKEIPMTTENNKSALMDYQPIPLARLIGMSQYIVMGTLTDVKEDFIVLSIKDRLSNIDISETIRINKFNPPAVLDAKAIPYHPGQEFIYFLSPSEKNSKIPHWNVVGFGGEGEMPIEDDFVYFEGSFIQGLVPQTYQLYDKEVTLQRFSLSEVKNAIIEYRTCFLWNLMTDSKSKRERWVAQQICEPNTLRSFQTTSWIANYLAETTKAK